MNKTDHQLRVEQFMRLAGQELPALPCVPSEKDRLLRAKLIFEEALETIRALGFRVQVYGCEVTIVAALFDTHDVNHRQFTPNLVEIADGCADLSVVSIGTLSACGIADAPLLAEVDASNLRKFAAPKCEACMSPTPMQWLAERQLWFCAECETLASKNVGPYRRDDGKWMKPPNWTPPDVRGVLTRQQWKERAT